MIVRPEIDAVTSAATSKTRLAWLPLIVSARRRSGDRRGVGGARLGQGQFARRQRDRLRGGEDGRVEGDRLGGAQHVGQVDRLAEAQLARCRAGAVGGRVDDQPCLGLEGADVGDGRVEREAALVGRDAAGGPCPCRWPGCRAAGPWSGSARRSRPAGPAAGRWDSRRAPAGCRCRR